MEQSELLRRVVEALEALDVPYFVTGSTATIFYGEPRFTADIDVVVELPREKVAAFVDRFAGTEFYLDEASIRNAISRRTQFNILHPSSGLKVDVILPGGGAFDRSRFQRVRRLRPAEDYEARFASPEDVILKKMAFYLEGGSEKHLRDIASVFRISGEQLDRDYLEYWVGEMALGEVWRVVLERVGEA